MNKRKTWYPILDKREVDNELGRFKVTVYKMFCDDYYKFEAKQIAVKHKGKLYHINPEKEEVCFPVVEPIKMVPYYATNTFKPIEHETIQLQCYKSYFDGTIVLIKDYYYMFIYNLKKGRSRI